MTITDCLQRKHVALCTAGVLLVSFSRAYAWSPPVAVSNARQASISLPLDSSSPSVILHVSLVPTAYQADSQYPENPMPSSFTDSAQNVLPDSNQSPVHSEQQENEKHPLGTAVAPQETIYGTSASRPAGAVIAPAKQHRARSLLIRVGVIAGTAIAIGTVVLLSKASPSHSH